jgi:hypothetical protein
MKHLSALLSVLFVLSLCTATTYADKGLNLVKREAVSLASGHSKGDVIGRKTTTTNFSGGWHGALVLVRSSCAGFRSSFGFRHIASLNGNRVVLRTSHDGTLLGMTRDKGRRLEAVRQYTNNGALITTAVVYGALNANSVRIGMSVTVNSRFGQCTAAYAGNGVRAF